MLKQKRTLFALFIIALLFVIWRSLPEERAFLCIPIIFSHKQPCVYANIEGKKLLFHLDSGASDCFTMNREILEGLKNKEFMEMKTWYDVQGNGYHSPRYVVKKADIDAFQLSNITVTEESVDFLFNGSKISKLSTKEKSTQAKENELTDIAGRIGSRSLRAINYWLLDLPNDSLIAIRDIEKIKNTPGFSFEGFTEVVLEKISPQIVISVDTDFGKKKLALDTGASLSVLSPPSSQHANHEILDINCLSIGGRDFGKFSFYLFQIPPQFAFEGLLGRDFLGKHAIYLDFKQNRAFIGPTHHTKLNEYHSFKGSYKRR